jgi:hypothetical protein
MIGRTEKEIHGPGEGKAGSGDNLAISGRLSAVSQSGGTRLVWLKAER